MKKILVLMTALVMTLSLAACGGDEGSTEPTSDTITPSSSVADTTKPGDLVAVTGNGLSFALPLDMKYVKTDENNGGMLFANEDRTAVVTVGVKTEDTVTSADITDDVLLQALSAGGGLSDAKLDHSGTVDQFGGKVVVGFGKGTLSNGTVMNSALQYFFPAEGGGYYVISYIYAVDVGSSLDANIEKVMATVKTAE